MVIDHDLGKQVIKSLSESPRSWLRGAYTITHEDSDITLWVGPRYDYTDISIYEDVNGDGRKHIVDIFSKRHQKAIKKIVRAIDKCEEAAVKWQWYNKVFAALHSKRCKL